MPTTTYTNFNGRIVHENRGGTQRDYMRDPIGSTAALLNVAGNESDRWEYWPYGEVAVRSGNNPTPFNFVGTLGYYLDVVSMLYVRARSLLTDICRWLTVDPVWPLESQYTYVKCAPSQAIDPSGLQGRTVVQQPSWTDLFGAFGEWCRRNPPRLPTTQEINAAVQPKIDQALIDLEELLSRGCRSFVMPCMKASSAFGKSKGNDRTNALGHCMTACCIQRHVPACVPYWNTREIGGTVGHKASVMDDNNNKQGYICSAGSKSCYACCLANESKLSWMDPKPHNWPPGGPR